MSWKFAVRGVHNYLYVLVFYFQSIAVNITFYVLYLFLPTHVLYISSGHFCAPEYCSVQYLPEFGCPQRIHREYYISGFFQSFINIVWYGLVVTALVSQARFRILHSAFFIFFFFPEFSSTSLKVTRILQYMDCKNGAGKFPSIYLLHCYPTVHLPDLSCKLKTVRNRNWFVRFHINNSND